MRIDSILPITRLIFGLVSFGLMAVILALIRRQAIKEKYVLLWLPLGLGLFLAGLFPDALIAISARLHLHYLTVVLMCVILVFTGILLYFTAKLSRLREDVKTLSQEIALMRERAGRSRTTGDAARPASGQAPAGWLPAQDEARRPAQSG